MKHRLVHAVWAALSAIVCLYLIFTEQTGHPPPIVLVPYVLVAWSFGHGFIWVAQRLAAKGRSVAGTHRHRREVRGPSVSGSPSSARVLPRWSESFRWSGRCSKRQWYPYPEAGLWVTMLLRLAGPCGIVCGPADAQTMVSPVERNPGLWFGRAVGQADRRTVGPDTGTDTSGVMIAVALIVSLLLFAAYLVWSREVRSFLIR